MINIDYVENKTLQSVATAQYSVKSIFNRPNNHANEQTISGLEKGKRHKRAKQELEKVFSNKIFHALSTIRHPQNAFSFKFEGEK